MSDSRGNAISSYSPAFSKGAQVYSENIVDGAVTSAKLGSGVVISGMAGAITSAYLSAGAVTYAKMKAAFLSGTISGLAGGAAVAVAHGLGVKPKSVTVSMLATGGEVTAKHTIAGAAASADTTTNIYLVSSKTGNVKYAAYVQI